MPLDVLVVEDDPVLAEVLTLQLDHDGCRARAVHRGDDALRAIAETPPDVVVLDLSLPGCSGLDVCRALRAARRSVGIVIVTARASEAEILLGFDSGADDYVVKPCRPREIAARVAALGRRLIGESMDSVTISRGALVIALGARTTRYGTHPLELTPTEFALLVELARAPGAVLSRRDLLARVWSSEHEGYARNVDCHVTRLRRKLEAVGCHSNPIETVHGVGYRFTTDAA